MSPRARPPVQPPSRPPVLVEDARSFCELMRVLEEAEEIAMDTEADSFYSYRERVCLIQVTALGEDYLVDPLRDFDVTPLGEILAAEEKTKIFHDGEYDVLILKTDFGFRFAGLFDTRIASAALGQETPGLASVVQERFGVELDKSQQRSDWSRRPLSESQITYARQDTRYLLPLMHVLVEELEETGRLHIVQGECHRLEQLEPTPRAFNADEFLRIKGARTLDRHQMQVLRELYAWRDGEASQRNVPPFKVLGNAAMLHLAEARPRTQQAIERVEGVSPRVVRRLGRTLLDVVHRAERLGPLKHVPSLPSKDGASRLDEASLELHDRLKSWRKQHAATEGMDASLVLNRHVLPRLASERPTTVDELASIDGLLAWQRESFGEELVAIVRTFEADLAAGRIELRSRRRRGR